jgi:hypothetical protein
MFFAPALSVREKGEGAAILLTAPWITDRARGREMGGRLLLQRGGHPGVPAGRPAEAKREPQGFWLNGPRGSPRQMVGRPGSRLECRESSGHRIKPESNVDEITPENRRDGPAPAA